MRTRDLLKGANLTGGERGWKKKRSLLSLVVVEVVLAIVDIRHCASLIIVVTGSS